MMATIGFIWNDKMGGHFSRWPPSAYIWIKTNVVVAELVVYLVSRIFLGRIKYVLFMSYKDKHVRSTLGGGIETNQSIYQSLTCVALCVASYLRWRCGDLPFTYQCNILPVVELTHQ